MFGFDFLVVKDGTSLKHEIQGILEILHSYAFFGHPCPILLPLASRVVAEAAERGALSPSKIAWAERCAAKLTKGPREADEGPRA